MPGFGSLASTNAQGMAGCWRVCTVQAWVLVMVLAIRFPRGEKCTVSGMDGQVVRFRQIDLGDRS